MKLSTKLEDSPVAAWILLAIIVICSSAYYWLWSHIHYNSFVDSLSIPFWLSMPLLSVITAYLFIKNKNESKGLIAGKAISVGVSAVLVGLVVMFLFFAAVFISCSVQSNCNL